MNADKLAQALRNVLAHGVEIPDVGIDDSDAFTKAHRDAEEALAEYDAQAGQAAQPADWPKGRVNVPYPLPDDPEARLVGFVIKSGHPWYGTGLSSPLFALDNACNASAPSAPLVGVPPLMLERLSDAAAALDKLGRRDQCRHLMALHELLASQPPAQPSADAEILYQQAMTGGGWSDISVEQYERIRSVYPEYVRIVYSTPIADAEDAARYRWLRSVWGRQIEIVGTGECNFGISAPTWRGPWLDLDAAIDAARAAEGGE